MTMTRTTRRFMIATASVAVLACSPGLTAMASASDLGSRSDDSGSISQSTLTQVQAAAVANARDAYLAAAATARATLKTALDSIWAAGTPQTPAQKDAAQAAFDTYRAAKDAAAAAYVSAVTAAFGGQTVPAGLLEAPRSGSRHHESGDCDNHGNDNHGNDNNQRDFGRSGGNGHHGSSRGMHH